MAGKGITGYKNGHRPTQDNLIMRYHSFLAALTFLFASCAPNQSERLAERAPREMIGVAEADLRRCAGPPTDELSEGGRRLLVYERSSQRTQVIETPRDTGPIPDGAMSRAVARSCRMDFLLENGRVAQVMMDGRRMNGSEDLAACGPIVQRCLERR